MDALELLKNKGIKPSLQRVAIMDYLLKHRTHPTIEEIYESLHADYQTLSRTTVYNTLKLFVRHGAALQIDIDERHKRFDGDTRFHGHFLCVECGRLEDLFFEVASSVEFPALSDCLIRDMQFLIKGKCKMCQNK